MLALAMNVVRENLRNRTLYLLGGLGLLLLWAVLVGKGARVEMNGVNLLATVEGVVMVGVIMTGLVGALVAVILSMNTVPREFERQTIHLLLVRPVPRTQLALAFLVGNLLTVGLFLPVLVIPLFGALAVREAGALIGQTLLAIPHLLLILALVAAVTTLLSFWVPGPVAAAAGLLLYGLGAFQSGLTGLAAQQDGLAGPLCRLGIHLLPPVEKLTKAATVLINSGSAEWRVCLPALLYLGVVAGLTALSLHRREA